MRREISMILLLLAVALGTCAAVSRRSKKAIGVSVSALIASLILPVLGNFIIIISDTETLSTVGCYIYFLGMNVVTLALLRFTMEYCRLSWPNKAVKSLVYLLLIADAVQLLANPIFGHAFATEAIMVDGDAYYRLIPYVGQSIHRIVNYGIFLAAVVVFFVRMLRSPRIYFERYSVIFFSIIVIGLWETFYIFSGSPVDWSMIGFGVFGLLVFYFALYYRPVRLLDRMLANVVSEMPQALFFFDVAGRCLWANRPGMKLVDLKGSDYESGLERLARMFEGIDFRGDEWSCQRVLGEDEGAKYYALEKHVVTDERDRKVGSFLSVRDETEQQKALKRERYNASHDTLTGLYTRERLYARIRETIDADPSMAYNICYLDVNDFKMVNDVFGSDFGDYALKCVAESLLTHLSPDSLCGRLGGDIFGVCIPGPQFDAARAEALLSNFMVRHGAVAHRMIIHQGVYRVTEPDMEVSVMFDRAHMALETIKDEYKKHLAFYDDTMRDRVLWEQHITGQLAEALEKREIRPYLQAMVDDKGKIVGAEALVRWIRPEEGLMSPASFVPIFERNGMIADVDKHMWRCACEVLARWQREGRDDLFISVNVSPKDFYFMDVVEELKSIVKEFGINPARLRVEITETIMMTDNENRLLILNDLREAGFLVEMDDFGSGYSSLNMLKDMPVDVVKIDMVFLNKAKDDRKAHTILRNIMQLTGELGIPSLSEGVETRDQYEMLAQMGCKMFQGYYFARPMPVEQFEELCAQQQI